MSQKRKVHVSVTGLNAGDSPAPGVPVARCLKECKDTPCRVIGLAYDALEPGILDSRMVDAAYLLPYPKSGKDILLERMEYIHKKERVDAVIPTLDAELINFIHIQDGLSRLGIKHFLPDEESFAKRAKVNLSKFCGETDVHSPKTRLITDSAKINVKKDELPVMIKGLFYEAYPAYSVDEAMQYIHKTANRWGYPVLVQEIIDGEEFNAAAVGDGKGKTVGGVACMKKLVFTDKGKGWACVSIKNDGLIKLTEKVIRALNWKGAIEVEAIYSKKEELFYVIEINPRFPAWIYLAKASGINLPYVYLKLALGKHVRDDGFHYKTGVVFTNYTTNLITDLSRIDTLFTAGELQYEKTV